MKGISVAIPGSIPRGVPEEIPKGISERIPREISERTPRGISDGSPGKNSQTNRSWILFRDMLVVPPERIPERNSEEILTKSPEESLEELP